MKNYSITLIIPYFGKWPRYINVFLKTCRYNPSINYHFFSDQEKIINAPDNVKFTRFSMADFNKLASEKLNLKIGITSAYKLCDFKPLYGAIFEDYLKNISFWGHCDIDVVWGNIRKFITDNILEGYDVISARKEFLAGHFALYRNNDKINQLFRKSADYVKVCEDPAYYFCFDECGFLWYELLKGESIWDHPAKIESMTHVIMKMEKEKYLTSYFRTLVIEQDNHIKKNNFVLEDFKDEVLWEKGRLRSRKLKKEFMYFHFHQLKNLNGFFIPGNPNLPDKFYVNIRGFFLDVWVKRMIDFKSFVHSLKPKRKKSPIGQDF